MLGGAPATAAPAFGTAEPTLAAEQSSGDFRAQVTAEVGGEWSVRFVDADGIVLATVTKGAIGLWTTVGRIAADRVISVEGDVVTVGSSAVPGLSAAVTVRPAGDGIQAVSVVGEGDVVAVSLDLRAPKGERYLGLGERSHAVDHRGLQVENRVLDGPYTPGQAAMVKAFVPPPGHSDRADATYFPMPWILSTSGYGVLVDNDEDSWFDLATRAHPEVSRLKVESDRLDLRVFAGPKPAQALARMTAAVGRQPSPPTPAVFGSWWQPHGNALTDLEEQRRQDVPISVAQTYVHYLPCGDQRTDRERKHTQEMHDRGVSVTAYFNPMVCTTLQPHYDDGVASGAFTKNPDGSTLVYRYSTATNFQVAQIDFSASAGRELFHRLLQESVDDGYDGWMEDFGEYTPDNAVSADGTPGPAMHNRYVEQYHASAQAFEDQAPRPLLRYTRSGWTDAIKSSPIVWGGDPTTAWGFDGLASSVTQGLSMGTSGVSTWGPDIGGFFTLPGDQPLSPELLTRWIEYGAFTGVMRLQAGGIQMFVPGERTQVTHPDVAPVWKKYSRLRTMLYPYVAGSHAAYEKRGMPLMRHLALTDPEDLKAVDTHDAYKFGRDLFVAPVIEPGATERKTYLPRGKWVELARTWRVTPEGKVKLRSAKVIKGGRTVTAKAPLGTIPLFLRVGSVLPMLPSSVDTLSEYGGGAVVRLADRTDERGLVAVPKRGKRSATLGPGESLTSRATKKVWTLKLDAEQARTYDVKANLAGLVKKAQKKKGKDWRPCSVTADGSPAAFTYNRKKGVLRVTAELGAQGRLKVTACR